MVFQELAPTQSNKIKSRHDLENELFGSSEGEYSILPSVRDNEGVAAEHGIYFDDTEYDYMQHIRELSAESGDGGARFVEAISKKKDTKGKAKMNIEDALRESSLHESQSENINTGAKECQLLGDDLLPSKGLKTGTYQDMQDIPDTLAGFQPDMDPRLREVLDALDDEAYVDDEEDIFGEIAKDGREVSLDEFEGNAFEEVGIEDAGWETDETEKPSEEQKSNSMHPQLIPQSIDTEMSDGPDHGDGDWMKEFSKFKQAEKAKKPKVQALSAEQQSSIITGTSMTGGRRKKRKGAMTSSTGYSMTSSSLFRTEGQSLLDARFDKIEEDYAEEEMEMDDGTASMMTSSSLASSQAPSLAIRSEFDNIMDEFLGGYSANGKRRSQKGKHQSGIEQLDEVRKGLGPARLTKQKA